MATSRYYSAYGLRIDSELVLPPLIPTTCGTGSDVAIRLGSVPPSLADPRVTGVLFAADARRYLLAVPDVARYLATGGRTVTVEPVPGADPASVAVHMLNPVMTALLHQRDLLVLRGCAIRYETGAVLLIGVEGAGTSSLAVALGARGHELISDDACALRLASPGGAAGVLPGHRYSKLWPEAAADFGMDLGSLAPLAPGIEKLAVPFPPARAVPGGAAASTPVRQIYVMVATNRPGMALTPVSATEKFFVLAAHTAQHPLIDAFGTRGQHFALTSALACTATVKHLRRPQQGCPPAKLATLVEKDLRGLDERGPAAPVELSLRGRRREPVGP